MLRLELNSTDTVLSPSPSIQRVAVWPDAPASSRLAAVARDLTFVLAWPLNLDLPSTIALGTAAIGSYALFRHDVALYGQVDGAVSWHVRGKSGFDITLLLGDGLVDLAIVSAFALGGPSVKRTWLAGTEALAAVAVTSVVSKHLFRVERPSVDRSCKRYFAGFAADAFPSGHTMSAFATAAVISAEYPGVAPLAYGAAGLVGLSVMKRGWHWPSDVLAGAVLGVVIGRTAVRINRHWSIGPTTAGAGLSVSGGL